MANLIASRTFQIVALGFLSALLLLGSLYLYLRSEEDASIELINGSMDSSAQVTGEPTKDTSLADSGADTASPLPSTGETSIRVYIAGAVQRPDVYTLSPDARLVDVLQAAGGGTAVADLESVNLALRVQDEGYYFIPARAPTKAMESTTVAGSRPASLVESPVNETVLSQPATPAALARLITDPMTGELPGAGEEKTPEPGLQDGLVNLNTATDRELETLPAIGPARAQSIIAYREQNGPFATTEEITAVSGIGPGIYSNLKSLITVGSPP